MNQNDVFYIDVEQSKSEEFTEKIKEKLKKVPAPPLSKR